MGGWGTHLHRLDFAIRTVLDTARDFELLGAAGVKLLEA